MQQTIETNPTPENPKHKIWGVVLKVIGTIVATLLGSLGLQSCLLPWFLSAKPPCATRSNSCAITASLRMHPRHVLVLMPNGSTDGADSVFLARKQHESINVDCTVCVFLFSASF